MVLPCVPPIAIALRKRISSASISARRTIGKVALARLDTLRIVLLDRGGYDNHFRIAQIFRLVADENRNALVAQPLHIGALGLVGALHLVAKIVQHFGDAAHADAADADEVHQADRLRHFHMRLVLQNSFLAPARSELLQAIGQPRRRVRMAAA